MSTDNWKNKFQDKIRKKELEIQQYNQEIQELQSKVREAKSVIQTVQELQRYLPKENSVTAVKQILRFGTEMAKVQSILEKAGKPMHISEILKSLGKEVNKANRVSVSGSLASYVRKQFIFTRPEPNTFGLKTMESSNRSDDELLPPDDFGVME